MHSLGKFPDIFIAEIAGQPDAIRRAGAAAADQAGELARLRAELGRRPQIVLTGMGSSYDACYPAATSLAERGVLATMVDAAELLHYRLDALDVRTVLVCVSQSGESAETVRVVRELRARPDRPFVVSVTNGRASSLAGLADLGLDTRAGAEAGPSTMTFAATLVMMAAATRALSGRDPVPAAEAEAAAAAAERLLRDPEHDARALAEWLGGRPVLALLGRGGSRAAAEMGALTLKEAARFPAESLQAAQFRHGPLEMAGPELAAVVFACEPRTRDLDLGLAADLTAAGAATLVISPDGGAPGGATGIAVGASADGLSPAVSIVPVQLLAWELARRRGLDPGTYTVASKVTTHE
jgi:glucosamine--fructose-6-phosphate aminotransferase (isomerizing)